MSGRFAAIWDASEWSVAIPHGSRYGESDSDGRNLGPLSKSSISCRERKRRVLRSGRSTPA
jgi:hypothetical protein